MGSVLTVVSSFRGFFQALFAPSAHEVVASTTLATFMCITGENPLEPPTASKGDSRKRHFVLLGCGKLPALDALPQSFISGLPGTSSACTPASEYQAYTIIRGEDDAVCARALITPDGNAWDDWIDAAITNRERQFMTTSVINSVVVLMMRPAGLGRLADAEHEKSLMDVFIDAWAPRPSSKMDGGIVAVAESMDRIHYRGGVGLLHGVAVDLQLEGFPKSAGVARAAEEGDVQAEFISVSSLHSFLPPRIGAELSFLAAESIETLKSMNLSFDARQDVAVDGGFKWLSAVGIKTIMEHEIFARAVGVSFDAAKTFFSENDGCAERMKSLMEWPNGANGGLMIAIAFRDCVGANSAKPCCYWPVSAGQTMRDVAKSLFTEPALPPTLACDSTQRKDDWPLPSIDLDTRVDCMNIPGSYRVWVVFYLGLGSAASDSFPVDLSSPGPATQALLHDGRNIPDGSSDVPSAGEDEEGDDPEYVLAAQLAAFSDHENCQPPVDAVEGVSRWLMDSGDAASGMAGSADMLGAEVHTEGIDANPAGELYAALLADFDIMFDA